MNYHPLVAVDNDLKIELIRWLCTDLEESTWAPWGSDAMILISKIALVPVGTVIDLDADDPLVGSIRDLTPEQAILWVADLQGSPIAHD